MFRLYREKKLIQEEKNWEKERDLIIREQRLKEARESLKPPKKKRGIAASKWFVGFLFANCTLIELFTFYITSRQFDIIPLTAAAPNLTPLITLIGAVVGEVISFAIYIVKSMKENSVGGIVYDTAMKELENEKKSNG